MSYQELVNRVLSVKHANIEMGLAKAREQRPFIEQVARKLDGTSWDYSVRMDRDFAVTFCVEVGLVDFAHQYQAVKQTLAGQFDVAFAAGQLSTVLDVSCRRTGYGCRVVFGDVPQ